MSRFRTSVILLSWLVLCGAVVPLNSARAETESSEKWTGYYLQAGIVGGLPDARQGNVDFGPGVGLSLTAGVRHNAYIAGELDFSHVWLSRTHDFTNLKGTDPSETDDSKNLRSYEISFNLKGYPLSYFEVSLLPDWVEPYLRFGVGFGGVDVGGRSENRFLIRVGGGVDLLIFDPFGLFVDVGYGFHTKTVIENEVAILDGQDQIRVGALIRF